MVHSARRPGTRTLAHRGRAGAGVTAGCFCAGRGAPVPGQHLGELAAGARRVDLLVDHTDLDGGVDPAGDPLVLLGELLVQRFPLIVGGRGEPAFVQDADGGLGSHHRDLGIGPGEDLGRVQRAGVHRDVGAAVDLAGHQGGPRDGGLAEGVQQLGSAAHHAAPLLVDTGQVTGHVDDDHQRDAERVTEPHETRRFLRALGVQAPAQAQRVVGQHPDGAAGEPAEPDHHRRRPPALQLHERFGAVVFGVEQRGQQRVHVVGASRRLRQQRLQIAVAGLGLRPVEMALLAEQPDQVPAARVGVGFVVGGDVAHPGLLVVGVGPAEGGHVDVLAGDAAHHVGTGHEHPAVRGHHDDVGERRPVGGAAGGEADDHRDLWDVSRGADHRLEHAAARVQRPHPLGEPGTAGVPETDDRALVLDGGVVGLDDVGAALHAHGTAHDGAVGAERDGAHTVDGAGRRQHTGAVTFMQQLDAALVEERGQP